MNTSKHYARTTCSYVVTNKRVFYKKGCEKNIQNSCVCVRCVRVNTYLFYPMKNYVLKKVSELISNYSTYVIGFIFLYNYLCNMFF